MPFPELPHGFPRKGGLRKSLTPLTSGVSLSCLGTRSHRVTTLSQCALADVYVAATSCSDELQLSSRYRSHPV